MTITQSAATPSLPARLAGVIGAAPIRAQFRRDDPLGWASTLKALPYIPVAYTPISIDYQLAYQRTAAECWDVSLVIYIDKDASALWPLSLTVKPDSTALTSHGFPVVPPLFASHVSTKSRKAITRDCLALANAICAEYAIESWQSAESFVDSARDGSSAWHNESMSQGATAALRHELFVDLSLEMTQIRAHFRKSYKPLVSSGTRLWRVGVLTASDDRVWNEFRELHRNVAGGVTRSAESWDVHHRAIGSGEALLIHLRGDQDEMVGGGFFNTTRDEGVYGVGAYDRTLFRKPLGHVVQHRAIEELKARGLRWYKIGWRSYPGDSPSPTEKDLSIGEFKQGFATHVFPQYLLRHTVAKASGPS